MKVVYIAEPGGKWHSLAQVPEAGMRVTELTNGRGVDKAVP
jgi:hypothetical protein